MADLIAQVELSDRQGSLESFSGSVGMAWTAVPTSATTFLQRVLISNPDTNDFDEELRVSFDGGSTIAATIYPSGSMSHTLKGNVKQIHIYGSTASVNYNLTIEREPDSL